MRYMFLQGWRRGRERTYMVDDPPVRSIPWFWLSLTGVAACAVWWMG
jgi:hypothetical protein